MLKKYNIFKRNRKEVPVLYDNTIDALQTAYTTLISGHKDEVIEAGKMIYQYFKDKNIDNILNIGKQFKSRTSMCWYYDFAKVDIEQYNSYFTNKEFYIAILKLGIFHPNGYLREKCLLELDMFSNTTPYIVLCMKDHVVEIREKAFEMAIKRMDFCSFTELMEVAYSLRRVSFGSHSDNTLAQVKESFYHANEKYMQQNCIKDIVHIDTNIKKAYYYYMFERKMFSLSLANDILTYEKDSMCQTIIINGIIKLYHLSIENIEIYLRSKNARIQLEALYYKYKEINDTWQGLEEFLLSKHYCIRDYVQFLYRKHKSISVLDYYIQNLPNPNAILGIGECGSEEDIDRILPLLDNDNDVVVKNTLLAISKLLGNKAQDIYWTYVLDSRVCVSKAAFLAIKNNKIKYGAQKVYEAYQLSPTAHVKSYLLRVLIVEDSWQRLPFLLKLYWLDSKMRDTIQRKVAKRNPYTKISKEEANNILSILDDSTYQIPKDVKESILFDLRFVTNK